MPDALLDTTVFIDAHNKNPRAKGLVAELTEGQGRLLFSPISVFELWLRRMDRAEEANHLSLLNLCQEATFDRRAALVLASWLGGQPRSGRRRLLGDAMIAATAASVGATIYTRNPRDFTRFYPDVHSY